MKLAEKYNIKEISYKQAMDVVVKYHYLHRKAPCSFAFSLFEKEELKGIVCYGTPSSAPLRRGICGEEEKVSYVKIMLKIILL